ncbi:Thioredoxin reductase [Richelia intracellularis]|nr:Thioredoxin reductase [Richelia intracellularis]
MEELHNYLGLAPNTPGRTLLKNGKDHYLSLGGDLLNGYVDEVVEEGDIFIVRVKVARQDSIYAEFRTKYLIAASGIINNLLFLDDTQDMYEYAAYKLHVCFICDIYEMVNKKVGVFGRNQPSLEVAFSLGWFSPHITLFTEDMFDVSSQFRQRIEDCGYQLVEDSIDKFLGENHHMNGV